MTDRDEDGRILLKPCVCECKVRGGIHVGNYLPYVYCSCGLRFHCTNRQETEEDFYARWNTWVEAATAPKWTQVSEIGKRTGKFIVLVVDKNGNENAISLTRIPGGWIAWDKIIEGEIVAFMPMPEPWKEIK